MGFGAVAMGAYTIGSGIYNAYQQYKNNQKTMERQDNAVQRQVADLKAAGLSPLMATGEGASSGGLVASSLDPNSGSTAYSAYMQTKLTKKQQSIDQFNAETARINATTQQSAVDSENALREQQMIGQSLQNFVTESSMGYDIEYKASQVDKIKADTDFTFRENIRKDKALASQLGINQKQYDKLSAEEQNIIARTAIELAQNKSNLKTQELQRMVLAEEIGLKQLSKADVSKKLEWFDRLAGADLNLKEKQASKLSAEAKVMYVNAVANVVSAVGRMTSGATMMALGGV